MAEFAILVGDPCMPIAFSLVCETTTSILADLPFPGHGMVLPRYSGDASRSRWYIMVCRFPDTLVIFPRKRSNRGDGVIGNL